MDLDEVTVADLFKKAGYRTGAFGKWHNGMQYPYHPNGRGFDEFYGFCSGHWGNYFDAMLEHNGRIVKGEGFCVDDFTNKAMDFIGEEPVPLKDDEEAHLLIEVDGNDLEVLMKDCERIAEVVESFECGEILFAEDQAKKEQLCLPPCRWIAP